MSVTIREWYSRVNGAWPRPVPPLTEAAARTAAKRLWRWGTGERLHLPVVITSGRRHTWAHRGTLRVNPGRGWDHFVHDLSHLIWQRVNPSARPHERGHARFELRMRREVQRRGWLDGALPIDDPAPLTQEEIAERRNAGAARAVERREARARAALESAEKKLARLTRRVRELRRKVRYYDRKAAARPQEPTA